MVYSDYFKLTARHTHTHKSVPVIFLKPFSPGKATGSTLSDNETSPKTTFANFSAFSSSPLDWTEKGNISYNAVEI